MILDTLENRGRYDGLHGDFRRAFAFLAETDLSALPAGRCGIDGDRLFAIVSEGPGRSREGAELEIHARYIDIQYVVSGTDEMGWKPSSRCLAPCVPYDPDKDIGFFSDAPDAWVAVPAGAFAVFFPEDAHLPLVSRGVIRKVVVKVAL
ncbi:MAG TPA: YhcH/YjgK/YiaL family protein [Candidatus Deferrimicrobiaceae bacterium]